MMVASANIKNRLIDGNGVFRKSTAPSLLARLSKKQEPFIAILTCSDSRVCPEKVFNLSLGDAFVVRAAGNSASDPAVLGSIEYAIEHLHVKAVLVVGHTSCRAVKAALEGKDPGNLSRVMSDIDRARYKTSAEQMNDPDAVAESNVRLQLGMLENNSMVIMDAVNKGELTLLGAMLDISTGAVRFF